MTHSAYICNKVSYQARMLHQKIHAYGASYMMQMTKFSNLQIMQYSKQVLRS